MLSVVNRGTQIAEETDGIPFAVIDGSEPYQFYRYYTNEYTMANIPVMSIEIEPTVISEYMAYKETIVLNTNHILVNITPTVVDGYTAITVNPTTR